MEVKTRIIIDNKQIDVFKSANLVQHINSHHFFKIILDQETIEEVGGHTIDKSKDWLGKPVIISFEEKEFIGVATDIALSHEDGHSGELIVSGYSKTILLESGKHMHSWLDKTLVNIVTETIDAAGVDANISPEFTSTIEYQSQYNETHYQFIQRLAKQYGEFFYYDGLKLIFGKPSPSDPIKVEYGSDLSNVKIAIKAVPNKANMFSYNALDDARSEVKSKDDVLGGLNELGVHSFNVSNEIFKIVPNNIASARVLDKSQIDMQMKKVQTEAVASLSTLTACSKKQGLGIGSTIKVSSAKYDKKNYDVKSYGEYMIIGITHTATSQGVYSNTFEAISSGVEVLPAPDVALPIAQPQIATVLSNEDPKNKGRVQVQFQWQKNQMKTSWLRVMTPDAGKSDLVGTNRGFVFVPEVDDQVMVGFRYSDPNRPFVMGSMFNGTTGAGGSEANKTKSLTTRSGATITIDDNEGDGKITVSDPSGNTITLNGDETITISAPKSILLDAAEITLLGKDKVHIESKEVTIVGTNSIKETSDTLVDIQSPKITASSDTTEIIAKMTVDIEGKLMTNVKGTIVNLN
ncbi:Vgr family protein [Tenacibaculum sp. Bg11-29]|uniref:type VI secretion system Vgr family protein n=1 Tax=Tenacibaculum sp. Bg11-29 TaxID=2058306 RepID=UPI000C32AE56|nr:phage baseplate assembly protein V [Tenacibaculum sp. Bg11-29]PKH51584.1 Vgr family protein [Tenacibaculum sp. Bg11-29]